MFDENNKIILEHYSHASLYVDMDCFACKKLVGLPNAIKWDGRHYHERCLPESYWQAMNEKLDWKKVLQKQESPLHEMVCRVCKEIFDLRDLNQVIAHEHKAIPRTHEPKKIAVKIGDSINEA